MVEGREAEWRGEIGPNDDAGGEKLGCMPGTRDLGDILMQD
jgi:hypothetical protein